MVLIQCLNSSFQVGVACGEFELRGGDWLGVGVCSGDDKQAQKTWHPASSFQQL